MPPPLPLDREDIADLRLAKSLLENPGFAARMSNLLGGPLERGFKMLPANWTDTVNKSVKNALTTALDVALVTLDKRKLKRSSEFFHKMMVGASGGIGGAFGLPALPLELPLSTTIMLRSIADIARSEGHNLSSVETKLNCLEVFAFGSRSPGDDSANSSYWAARAALCHSMMEAVAYVARTGAMETTAPALVRLVASIASRFGVVVSEQVAAKAVPIVGAAGGAVINVLFIDHFQDMARGHFMVKRLEKKYGTDAVQVAYDRLPLTPRLKPTKTLNV